MYERRGGRNFGNRDRGFGDRGFGGRSSYGGGGYGDESRDFQKPPVNVGEEYDVTITDVGAKGDGITKVKNFIIFVPNANKGDQVKIKIREVARKFAIADIVGSSSGDKEDSKETTDEYSGDESSEEEETSEDEVSEEESDNEDKEE
ncbi:MAG: TRAM domain-containing protein [Candidatus Aenigmatarchaeota archaeon]